MRIEDSPHLKPKTSSQFPAYKRIAYLSSDPYLLLDSLIENYLLALPPLHKKWILVPHLSWKTWLERQITLKTGVFTSCEITTPDALITSFSKVHEAILSPGEIALLCSSFQHSLEEFLSHNPTYPEIQNVGKLLFELGYLEEKGLSSLLKDVPSLLFLYQQLYSNKSPFTPWSRKLKNPISLKTPIALFQIPELPPSFISLFEGEISWFCLEPTSHFWADEFLRNKKMTDHLIPHLFMQFGEVRKSRMKQILDCDMELEDQFSCEELDAKAPSFDALRRGLSELDDELIEQELRNSLDHSSLQVALVGSPLEEVRFVATLIEQKIQTKLKELPFHESNSEYASFLLSSYLDEILILTPPHLAQEYASLFEVELARITPKIPASFERVSSSKSESLMANWLSLLSPLGDGEITALIFSDEFFDIFEIERKDHSVLDPILSLFKHKEEKRSLREKNANALQDKLDLIQFLIAIIEKELFSYQGAEELMQQFLKKLFHLSSSLRPWQQSLSENQSKTLAEWHAIFETTAKAFFEESLHFENPLSALIEKSKHQWNVPIECRAILSFSRMHSSGSESNLARGVLRVRPFSYSCITPSKTLFLLGMGPQYAGLFKQVFPWLFSKERLLAKTPPSSLEKDTLFDLFLLAKEELIITSSDEGSLQESPFIRAILSSCKLELNAFLTRPSFLTKTTPSSSLNAQIPSSKPEPESSLSSIDLADLFSFAQNPLRYSLKKHLSSLLYCPDRKRQIEENFVGKTSKPSELLKFTEEEFLVKREEERRNEISKTGLLGAVGNPKIAPFLEIQSFITQGRFDLHFTPLQNTPSWHSSSLLLHPVLSSQDLPELRGFISGLHREGVLLFQSQSASSLLLEKIEKWPLMLLQTLLSNETNSSLKKPKWIILPEREISPCKADLHASETLEKCFYDLIALYQKVQKVPCLYTPEWIENSLKKGSSLNDLFQSEIADSLGTNSFGTPSSERSLAMAYAAEKEWFENALTVDFTQELKAIYSPLLENLQDLEP